MKNKVIILLLVLCGSSVLFAQNILPGYSGYWERARRINIIDLIEFYPDQLPYLRNEIYARYGRPFVNKTYQDYFKAKSWYQEKGNFSESWLSQIDRANAEFIASVEQDIQSADDVTAKVLRNIEYTGNRAVLTFTSRRELRLTDPEVDFGPYGLSADREALSWFVMGGWILGYRESNWGYDAAAYKLDHSTKRIIDSVFRGDVDEYVFSGLLRNMGQLR